MARAITFIERTAIGDDRSDDKGLVQSLINIGRHPSSCSKNLMSVQVFAGVLHIEDGQMEAVGFLVFGMQWFGRRFLSDGHI